MRIGCCTNMLASEGDSVGQWAIEDIAEFGYEYLDLPVAQMMELDDGEFEKLKQRIQAEKYLVKAARADYFPMLTGFGSMARTWDSEDFVPEEEDRYDTVVAGIALQIPLYQGGVKNAKVNQAMSDLNK